MTALPAGPELDQAVCQALTRAGVAGWEPVITCKYDHAGPCGPFAVIDQDNDDDDIAVDCRRIHCVKVSTDPAACFRLIEAMRGLGFPFKVRQRYGDPGQTYRVTFHEPYVDGEANSLLHCIALATLNALNRRAEEALAALQCKPMTWQVWLRELAEKGRGQE